MTELENAVSDVMKELTLVMMPIATAFEDAYKAIGKMLGIKYPEAWERYADESLLAWGQRLEWMGLLDNPDIRWEYQKAMLSWLVSPLVWIWRKIR